MTILSTPPAITLPSAYSGEPFQAPGTLVIPVVLRELVPDRYLPDDLAKEVGAVNRKFSAARYGAAGGAASRAVSPMKWHAFADTLHEFSSVRAFSASVLENVTMSTDQGIRLSVGDQFVEPPLRPRLGNLLRRASLHLRDINGDCYDLADLTIANLSEAPHSSPASVLEIMTVVGEALVQLNLSCKDSDLIQNSEDAMLGQLMDSKGQPNPHSPWILPESFSAFASEINGDDPRFRDYLQPGENLSDAANSQSISREVAQELLKRIGQIARMPIQEAVQDLVFHSCTGNPHALDRDRQLDISLDNGWQDAFIARYGLDGNTPMSLEEASKFVPSKRSPSHHVTRERVRQQCDKVSARLPSSAWLPTLSHALRVVVAASPIQVGKVGRLLAPLGLANSNWHGKALMSVVELTGTSIEAITGTRLEIRDDWLYDVREKSVISAVAASGKHTSKYGLTTLEELRQALSTYETPVDPSGIERVLQASTNIRWTSDGWLWDASRDISSPSTNTLRNHVRNILSVNSPQPVASVYAGFRRSQKFRNRDIVPSLIAVTEFLSNHPEFSVTDGHVGLTSPLDYHDVLGPVAAQIVDVLRANPFGAMDRSTLIEECMAAGINKSTIGVWTTYSEWMQNFGRNVWGLRGTAVAPSVVEEIQAAALRRGRGEPRERSWTWSAEGKLILVADVNTALWTTGAIIFSSSLRQIIGSRRFTTRHNNGTDGDLSFSEDHDWTWGWGRSLHSLGARVGDRMQATLDLSTGSAWLELSDNSPQRQ